MELKGLDIRVTQRTPHQWACATIPFIEIFKDGKRCEDIEEYRKVVEYLNKRLSDGRCK